MNKDKKKKNINEIFKHAFLWFVYLFAFFPLYLMVNISLKDNVQFSRNPWFPEAPFHWGNYAKAWELIGPTILNTITVAFSIVILTLVLAVVGAYFFARYKMPGSNILFYFFLILMMYPGIANMVPTFKLISSIGLYNSYWALIILGVTGGQVFNIYVLKNFIEELPSDLFDSAEIDGASAMSQIRHIVIPLSMPIIGTLAVLAVIGQWNNFVGPLIFIRDHYKQMLPVALLHLEGEYTKKWGELMAGYTIASFPLLVVFTFSMRLFIRGLSEGGIK